MKKPTMQDVADAAGVSRVTVWKVLNKHTGVSKSMSRQILGEAARLGYPIPDDLDLPTIPVPSKTTLTSVNPFRPPEPFAGSSPTIISVVVSRPDSSVFWSNTIHEIAKEAAKLNCNLMYTYVPTGYSDEYQLPLQLHNGTVEGIIIMNVYDKMLLTKLNELSIPKVFLDTIGDLPPEQLHGDLFLLEGKHSIEILTDCLIEKGRKRIGFIGDIQYAVTNHMRYEGYLQSMQKHHLPVDPAYCKTGTIGVETYWEEIHSYLDSLKQMPDAFVCVSDFVAYVVYQYLFQHGIPVPDEVSLTGFDNVTDYIGTTELLPTVNINTSALGRRLTNQLKYRISNPTAPKEVIMMQSEVLLRGI